MTHRVVLIRHAEATCNMLAPDAVIDRYDEDAPLTRHGAAQADRLADALPAALLGRTLFSSPLRRAADTTAVLARRHGLPVVFDERLAEMRVIGPLARPLSLAEWDAMLERRVADPAAILPPGVETLDAQAARVRDFLAWRHAARGDDAVTLIVAHAFTIELALVSLLGLDTSALARFRIRSSNTGVHMVECDRPDGAARLMLVNACHHLDRWA